LKKIPETDAIFDQLRKINREADKTDGVLCVSMDAKASVELGPFSRGGQSRVEVEAADHDFGSECSLTPFSILLPQYGDLFTSFLVSKITSDYIWDRLEELWTEWEMSYRPSTLVINQDNGPENSSRRTQFIKRAVGFANQHGVSISLAYYLPATANTTPLNGPMGLWNSIGMACCSPMPRPQSRLTKT
jgi:hypothetical protein